MNPARFLHPTRGFLNTDAVSRRIPARLTRTARAYHEDCIGAPAPVRTPGRLSGAPKIGSKGEARATTTRASVLEPPSTTKMKEKLYALQYTRR
jgi:hypothetical protein